MDIKVLIVDPGEVYRRALTALLTREGSNMKVVGEAHTPTEASTIITDEKPSVVVLGARRSDDHLLVTQLRRVLPDAQVVVLSHADDGPTVVEALRAGALGFVPMGAPEEDILAAIGAVADGRPAVHPSVAGDALMWVTHSGNGGEHPRPDEMLEALTRREREILGMLAEGMTPAQIASELFVSRRTVETHLANAYRKLGVHGRIEAIRRLELQRSAAQGSMVQRGQFIRERRGA